MSLPSGTHHLGPDNATLSVRTTRGGAAAKAGHDLLIHVTSWSATIVTGEDGDPAATSMELHADGSSLRVIEGKGGIQALGDDDIANIQQTIDDEVLKRQEIEFRSTRVGATADDRLAVEGELTLVGNTNAISFELHAGDARVSATATVTQTEWGMKPYSALFGALKVADDVEVALEGRLQPQSR